MFFPRGEARAGLVAVRDAVRPGGIAVVNVLVEGSTYLEMFDARGHCLFRRGELARAFDGWGDALRRGARVSGALRHGQTLRDGDRLAAAAGYAAALSFGRAAFAGLQNTLWRVAISATTSALASE